MTDVVGWDVRTWSKAVQCWEQAIGDETPPLQCLELGAGPGGPSLWLALKGHHVLCTNQDSTEQFAAPLHRRYDFPGTIEYRDLNARAIPFDSQFDVVVFKSVLGGVGGAEDQERMLAGIHRALKPGGRLLFAENIRGTVAHRAARALMNRRRRANWQFNPLGRLRELLSDFSDVELHTNGVLAVFGLTEGQRRALAALDPALSRVTPPRWQYMAYGVATR
jgi:SAM-dependent methyltransferase